MKPYKIILWGGLVLYDLYRKCIEKEIIKGNIVIEALVLNEYSLVKRIDRISVITLDELASREFDYLVDLNQDTNKTINNLFIALKVPREKIIPIHAFAQPCFDFERWVNVKDSGLTIVSNHFWGGILYNTFGLEFHSPFINITMEAGDFITLISDLKRYMELPLEYVGEGFDVEMNKTYPVGKLDEVKINFNYASSFEDAHQIWEKRKKRINYSNILLEMTTDNPEYLECFLSLPYEHKICFTSLPYEHKDVISLNNTPWLSRCNGAPWNYANRSVMSNFLEYKDFDLLKLLNHESDYRRRR